MTSTKIIIRKFLPLLVIPFLTNLSAAYVMSSTSNVAGQDAVQRAPGSLITPVITSQQERAYPYDSGNPNYRHYVKSSNGDEFPFRLYVTPHDQAIQAFAAELSSPRDAYEMAVQWIYVSEEKLNNIPDKWLTPHEFLTNTPNYLDNPLKGEVVSDCEEQANTLVSIIRAMGIGPEEVRVVFGEVICHHVETGHVWVELFMNGQWVTLDPTCGPYWDNKAGKLVRRQGMPFDYYARHTYPVIQIWGYYNDIYYVDKRAGTGNAPTSWRSCASAKIDSP